MFRRTLKRVYYGAAALPGVTAVRVKRLQDRRLAPVLNLHRVSPEPSDYWPPLSPRLFEELVVFLKSRFSLCRISELHTAASSKPVAALSFDDGYYDFIEYALPILEKYHVPANMNVIPNCAITGRPIWNVQLYDFLHASSRDEINALDIDGFALKLDSSPRAKARYGVQLSRYLKNRPRSERQAIWQSIEPHIQKKAGVGTRMMTTEELRQISDKVDLGAHSFSHESMAFEDSAFFDDDLKKCRDYFENELGKPLTIYAFPNGSHRPEQIGQLRDSCVKHILLVQEKLADITSDVLNRITIYGDTAQEVKMRALGF